MASSFFNDKIFAQDVLDALIPMIAPLNFFTRDVSSEASAKGDAIIVPLTARLTATTFAYANNSAFPYENTDGTVSAITVNLTEHHIQGIEISDIQAVNSSSAKASNLVKQSASAVAERLLSRVLSCVLTTNFPGTVTTQATASFDIAVVRKAKRLFEQANVPKENRAIICDPEIEDALLGLTAIQAAYAYGGPEAIRDGFIPKVLGFNVLSSNLIPLNAISLVGFSAQADGIVFASRYLTPQSTEGYDAVEQVSHPSGFTMGYRRHFNPGRGKMYANFEVLFGFTVGLTSCIGPIVKP